MDMMSDWISAQEQAPTFPCVIWDGQQMHIPSSMIVRNPDGIMHYYDPELLEGTWKEIDERDLTGEPEILLWHPIPPLPEMNKYTEGSE